MLSGASSVDRLLLDWLRWVSELFFLAKSGQDGLSALGCPRAATVCWLDNCKTREYRLRYARKRLP